jgi:hypothetical protein
MSAPLVVNTRDGVCWTRRTVTSGGIALYAPESVKTCPDFVMATEAELAEHGIVGSADVLPVPVREEPQPRTMLDHARDALNARMAKDDLRLVLENTVTYAASLQARVAELEAAAKEIQRLHTDSPMGPCPVCIDGDAMVRGDDYTVPYPCPTARLAGAKDCDPPSRREGPRLPAGPKPTPMTVYLSTPCTTCDHTLNWHRNDVGCTVGDCACGRFAEPTSMGGDR